MSTIPGFSQRKYYEYNNPEALKLNKKRMALLTSTEWHCKQLDVFIRGNRTTYKSSERLAYNPDGTYSCFQFTGTWKVQYNRYLVHSASPKKEGPGDPILGIYSVTELNDSSLTLTKLQSSTRDMERRLKFQKTSSRKEATDTAAYAMIRTVPRPNVGPRAEVDTFRKVFDESEPVNFYIVPQRSNVPTDQLNTIDSLALAFVKKYGGDHRGPVTIRSLKPYFRQYVGYIDKVGNHIIYLNALVTYNPDWEKELIMLSTRSKVQGFRIYVDLTRRECFGLKMYEE